MTWRRGAVLAVALAAVVALAAGVLWRQLAGDALWAPSAPRDGGTLFALSLPDPSGREQPLAQWKGKVLVVNFWATWCEPCLEELPSLERLRSGLAEKDFVVLAVQMGGSARTARDVGRKLGLRFPLLLDRDSSTSTAWGVSMVPMTFLIDRSGALAFRHVGELDWDGARARRRVAALLRR